MTHVYAWGNSKYVFYKQFILHVPVVYTRDMNLGNDLLSHCMPRTAGPYIIQAHDARVQQELAE